MKPKVGAVFIDIKVNSIVVVFHEGRSPLAVVLQSNITVTEL